MHARPHCRKDQLPLRSLRDLRSRKIFAAVRPHLATWEHKRPQEAAEHESKQGHIRVTFFTLNLFQIENNNQKLEYRLKCRL